MLYSQTSSVPSGASPVTSPRVSLSTRASSTRASAMLWLEALGYSTVSVLPGHLVKILVHGRILSGRGRGRALQVPAPHLRHRAVCAERRQIHLAHLPVVQDLTSAVRGQGVDQVHLSHFVSSLRAGQLGGRVCLQPEPEAVRPDLQRPVGAEIGVLASFSASIVAASVHLPSACKPSDVV